MPDAITREHVAAAVSRRLHECGISASEIARQAGLSREAVSLMRRQLQLPGAVAAVRIAGVIGCTVDELLGVAHRRRRANR